MAATTGSARSCEYNASGTFLHSWQVAGHNDGLKIDPEDGQRVGPPERGRQPQPGRDQPEDDLATQVLLRPPDNGGTGSAGGYDDITFLKDKVYLTESNPDPTSTGSAVVQVKLPLMSAEATR